MPVGVRVPPPAPRSLGLADDAILIDFSIALLLARRPDTCGGGRQWASPRHASKLSTSRCDERQKAASCGWGLCVSPGKVAAPADLGRKSVARARQLETAAPWATTVSSLLVSANLDTAARAKASAANPLGFLEKPYTASGLLAAVAAEP